eukprot:m.155128 g.155128  ORF g.155128 m.155128 type:complete len:783 (+) comp14396_c0_seq2:174-2522(+)
MDKPRITRLRAQSLGRFSVASVAAVALVLLHTGLDGAAAQGSGNEEYDDHCRAIVHHAMLAAQKHNQDHDEAGAEAEMELSAQAFEAAIKVIPDMPQAYANMAQALHNSNRLEQALPMWDATLKYAPEHIIPTVRRKRRHTLYGVHSMARDQAYSEGAGNVSEAHAHALRQLEVYPASPIILHDIATLELMLVERAPDRVDAARERFAAAAAAATAGWIAGEREANSRCTLNSPPPATAGASAASGPAADADPTPTVATLRPVNSVLPEAGGDGETITAVTTTIVNADGVPEATQLRYVERRTFVAALDSVEISGKDAVVLAPRKTKPCAVYTDTSFPYIDLALNLELIRLWADESPPGWHNPGGYPGVRAKIPPPAKFTEVASIVSFAGLSFYHFLLEGLPRLLLLRPLLAADPALKVLSCRDTTANKFPTQYLGLIPGLDGASLADRFVEYECRGRGGVRARAKRLHYPSWDPVEANHPSHCLPPHSLLRELRAVLTSAVGPPSAGGVAASAGGVAAPAATASTDAAPLRRTVVFVSREGLRMRQLAEESGLVAAIEAALPEGFSLTVFRGNGTAVEALRLFASAAAVVGVHGGALANIVACAEGECRIFSLCSLGHDTTRTRALVLHPLSRSFVSRFCVSFTLVPAQCPPCSPVAHASHCRGDCGNHARHRHLRDWLPVGVCPTLRLRRGRTRARLLAGGSGAGPAGPRDLGRCGLASRAHPGHPPDLGQGKAVAARPRRAVKLKTKIMSDWGTGGAFFERYECPKREDSSLTRVLMAI